MVITPHVKILSHICHVYSITLSFPVLYMCGLVASPGALKPSVGNGTESSWPLVHTYLSLLSSLPSLGSYLHLFSGVYVNNNNNNNNNNRLSAYNCSKVLGVLLEFCDGRTPNTP